jgi:demethylmenaquinone methyltransferase/2-methoxy-6-polyprenyl-1,4-benzoquinol methylase
MSTGKDEGADRYLKSLLMSRPLREPVLISIVESMRIEPGSRGLDAGCGAGTVSMMLADAVGPGGLVAGLDAEEPFLAYAGGRAASAPQCAARFLKGDITRLPFADGSLDWAISVDCAGVISVDPVATLSEMGRVVRPGGTVAIAVWSSQTLLPGHPLTEATLNATSAGIAPFSASMKPDRHILRAGGWFTGAGFRRVEARTFIGNITSPLGPGVREALADLFAMRWGGARGEVSDEMWAEYLRLCDPSSPDFIADIPCYCAFFTYTMFSGTR